MRKSTAAGPSFVFAALCLFAALADVAIAQAPPRGPPPNGMQQRPPPPPGQGPPPLPGGQQPLPPSGQPSAPPQAQPQPQPQPEMIALPPVIQPLPATPVAPQSAASQTQPLENAVAEARRQGEPEALGASLLALASEQLRLSQPRKALPPLDEAIELANQHGIDRLGREASLMAASAYDALADADMAATARRNADLYRDRIARSSAPQPLPEANDASPATIAAASDAPISASPVQATEARSSDKRWWLLLPVFALLAWGWLRSKRKAEALEDETERLARHQRQLKSAHLTLQQQAQQLRQTATHDALTGVLTRKAFASALDELIQHAQHYGKPVWLMVFDLDHFKTINDSHGHLTGDAALKMVVGVVRENLDSDDLFGRFGGDEFLVGGIDRYPAQALELAEAIRASVKRHAQEGDQKLSVLSISIGVAHLDAGQGYDSASLFSRADTALYAAKREGRNRAVLADAGAMSESGNQFPLRSLTANPHEA